MERRDVLRLLMSTSVLSALSPEAFSLFRSMHAQIPETAGLKSLNPHQNATVVGIADLIIPETDSPGAKSVKVNEFIDLILTDWYDEAETARFLAGLADVDARSQDLFGNKFIDCAAAQQNQILQQLDDESTESLPRYPNPSYSKFVELANPPSFFLMMKKLTLIGYYTSEVGFEQELHRSIIPPGHAGCAPVPPELAN